MGSSTELATHLSFTVEVGSGCLYLNSGKCYSYCDPYLICVVSIGEDAFGVYIDEDKVK
jgi:hypothetical protein